MKEQIMNEEDLKCIKSFDVELNSELMGSKRHYLTGADGNVIDEACFMFFPNDDKTNTVLFEYIDWSRRDARTEMHFLRNYRPSELKTAVQSIMDEVRGLQIERVKNMIVQSYESTHHPFELGEGF